jgi:hypothetical protein
MKDQKSCKTDGVGSVYSVRLMDSALPMKLSLPTDFEIVNVQVMAFTSILA